MVDEVHNGSGMLHYIKAAQQFLTHVAVQQRNLLEVTWTPHLDDLFLMLEMLDILALASTWYKICACGIFLLLVFSKALFRLLALEICSAFWFKLKGGTRIPVFRH